MGCGRASGRFNYQTNDLGVQLNAFFKRAGSRTYSAARNARITAELAIVKQQMCCLHMSRKEHVSHQTVDRRPRSSAVAASVSSPALSVQLFALEGMEDNHCRRQTLHHYLLLAPS